MGSRADCSAYEIHPIHEVNNRLGTYAYYKCHIRIVQWIISLHIGPDASNDISNDTVVSLLLFQAAKLFHAK